MKLLRTLLVLAPLALGAQSVVGTKHDLSFTGANKVFANNVAQNQVCVYCHTPHNSGASTNGPLWNRAASAAVYTMYPQANLKNTIAATPGAQSMACLSCHDGTVAMFSLVNTYTGTLTAANLNASATGNVNKTTGMLTGLALVGPSLTSDHPIAVDYNPTVDTSLKAIASVTTAGLKLYGAANKVECASCHDVHNNANGLFLRMSNASSALCTTCHSK